MASIPIAKVADELGVCIRHALRLVQKRAQALGLQPHYGRRNAVSLSRDHADRLIASYHPRRNPAVPTGAGCGAEATGFGFFYIIQLHPEDIPDRIKIGFTDNLNMRLCDHRTTAPTLKLLKSWPCKRIWERAAMDSITRDACRSHGGEVYDGLPQGFIDRAEAFFALMPRPSARAEGDTDAPRCMLLAQQNGPVNGSHPFRLGTNQDAEASSRR